MDVTWDPSNTLNSILEDPRCRMLTHSEGEVHPPTKCTCLRKASQNREKLEAALNILHTKLQLKNDFEAQLQVIQSIRTNPHRSTHALSYEIPTLEKEEGARYSQNDVVPLCHNAVRRILKDLLNTSDPKAGVFVEGERICRREWKKGRLFAMLWACGKHLATQEVPYSNVKMVERNWVAWLSHLGPVTPTYRNWLHQYRIVHIAQHEVLFAMKESQTKITNLGHMARILELTESQEADLQRLEILAKTGSQVLPELLDDLKATVTECVGAADPSNSPYATDFQFIRAETWEPSPPHSLFAEQMQPGWVAWAPLSEAGMFLQVWRTGGGEGSVTFIPYRRILLLPGDTVIGKGLCSCPLSKNLSLEMYIQPGPEVRTVVRMEEASHFRSAKGLASGQCLHQLFAL